MTNDIQITLLTSEEYEQYKDIIPLIDSDWWWLKDAYPRSSYVLHCVNHEGSGDITGCGGNGGVRPALHINLTNQKSLNLGDHIRIGSKSFTVLSWENEELFALCDECIAIRRFASLNNDWESSELKQWLETEGIKLIF